LGGWWFKARLGKQFARPHLQKITKAEWTGGVAQVVEYLLCSNASPTTKKKKKERKKETEILATYN
jgi:hypothetical protein